MSARPWPTQLEEQDPEDLVYEIDAAGTIQFVSAQWDVFALANGTPQVRSSRVLGRSLWDFFSDLSTISAHQTILDRCGDRHQRATFFFRNDAPSERRLMRMWIDPLADGGFRFTTRPMQCTASDPKIQERLLRLASSPQLARCGHCSRYRWAEDWWEPEDVIIETTDHRPLEECLIVHTICPDCAAELRSSVQLVSA